LRSPPPPNAEAACRNGATPGAAPSPGADDFSHTLTVMTPDEERGPPQPASAHSHGVLQRLSPYPATSCSSSTCLDGGLLRISSCRKRTIVVRGDEFPSTSLQLIDCHGCYIYILAPLRSAELVGCCGCTVLCGAVQRVVSVQYCERLVLLAAAAALRLGNCIDTTLHLCVNAPPLIWGENHRLTLAPFGTVYRSLAEHLDAVKVKPQLEFNFWGRPFDCCANLTAVAQAETGEAGDKGGPLPAQPLPNGCALMAPSNYLPFHVPVEVPAEASEGRGVPPVCELPTEYAEALAAHIRRLGDFERELAALQCSGEVRREVQNALQASFKEWLVRTGNMRQLNDLMAAM